ncbi:hypothetical protein LSTR_LSTR013880 [Laodelphax striatellus]|uniref:SEFIR domain-containing protein n=1 Tax=Laodelphax striatellus TaxID=195883 RepID=A0A482XCG4_LAOST|nr:hypothetical protein LSTR_LSTR013880 [Laodelphax striatellus]
MCADEVSRRHVEIVRPNKDCNKLDCKCSSGNDSKSPLKMTVTNRTIGSLTVSFRIVDDLIHKELAEVVLKVNNKLNETECQKKGNHFQDLMRKQLRLIRCDLAESSNCDEATDTVVVDFKNLRTACSNTEGRHEKHGFVGEKSAVASCPNYVATGHAQPIDKSNFDPPNVVCQFLEGGALNINIRPLINGSTDPNQFLTTIIDENNDTNYFFPNESNFKVLEEGILSYQYNTLKPGNYCHGIRYRDGRCLLSTHCDCVWRQRVMVFESKPATAPKEEIKDSNSTSLLITMTVLTLIGLFLATTFFVLRFIRMLRAPQTILPTSHIGETHESLLPLHLKARKKIFLLYARDCQLFMEAMGKLRMVLSLNGCEVFDVWDPQLIEKIRQDPMRFVQSHVVDVTTTTIVVASECSKFICDNYSEAISVHYKEPQEFDNLFLYGLKFIIENFKKKCFVVRLESQTTHVQQSDDIQLSGINILENYMLPLHLEQLILNIHRFVFLSSAVF